MSIQIRVGKLPGCSFADGYINRYNIDTGLFTAAIVWHSTVSVNHTNFFYGLEAEGKTVTEAYKNLANKMKEKYDQLHSHGID